MLYHSRYTLYDLLNAEYSIHIEGLYGVLSFLDDKLIFQSGDQFFVKSGKDDFTLTCVSKFVYESGREMIIITQR